MVIETITNVVHHQNQIRSEVESLDSHGYYHWANARLLNYPFEILSPVDQE
jgi:hypothetical protein